MKLIVCDFDNTLKIHNETIMSEKLWRDKSIYSFHNNYLALQKTKDMGDLIVLATGRDMHSLNKALHKEGEDIKLFDYICCTEGAALYDSIGNVLEVTAFGLKEMYYLQKLSVDGVEVIKSECEGKLNRVIYRVSSKELHKRILDKLLATNLFDIRHDETDIQVLPKSVNKCTTIDKLVNKLKLNKNSVYCFGDSSNDLELFQEYIGIAMRWSEDSLMNVACGVVDSVSDGLRMIQKNDNCLFENKVVFEFGEDEISYAKCLIKKYKMEYSVLMDKQEEKENKLDLSFDFDEEKDNYKKYCSNIRLLIKKIVNNFIFFEGYDVNVVVTGSFSRDTAKTFSDIDVSLFYEDKYYPYLRKYEELFYYILMIVFELPRRSVHSVLLTDSLKFDAEEQNSKCDLVNTTVQFVNNFGTVCVSYDVQKESVAVITRIDRTSRNLPNLRSYILQLVGKNVWKEWFVNYILIKGDESYWNLLKNEVLERGSINKKDIWVGLEKQRLQLKKHIENSVINSIDAYKYNYQTVLLLFFFDIKSFLTMCQYTDERLDFAVYEYLWLIRGIAKSFKKSGYVYSSHQKNQFVDVADARLNLTKNKALEIIDMIGEIDGFSNSSDEE